ncbi:MAG: IclR family transcriptional regulator [Acidobacteriota bacterium]|nr:IclR family transcriptional regulator [Acidobacteriota bacterium]MDE3163985.1 IclR family transcriptional regulator [Acidobacteriota bacterium]
MKGKSTTAFEAKKPIRRRIPKWALQSATDTPSSEQYYLRSIGRALDVLDSFDGKAALALKDIGAKTGLPESTLFRVLLTLEKHGYLQQAVDGTYQLAPRLRFGWLIEQANVLRDKARPELERLAHQFNETASLAYLYEDRIHVLDSVETFHEIRMSNRIGRVLPPHCSAMGKAITAFQEQALADQILEIYGLARRTEHTITDRARLFAQFAEIRRTGIAADREESILGGICYSAAIRAEGKPVVAALSLSTPILRMTPERDEATRKAVLEAASRIAAAC